MASSARIRLGALVAGLCTVSSAVSVPATAAPAPTTSYAAPAGALHRIGERARPSVLVAEVAPGTSLRTVASRAEAGPGRVQRVLAPLRRVSVSVPAADLDRAAERLRALPGVERVTRAAYRYVSETPNDPLYASHQAKYLSSIAAPAAWSRTHGSPDVRIAVVDTGADVGKADLDGKVLATYNAHDNSTDVTDVVGHGTFVAGVAAAETGNGTGVAGAGYDASLLIAKVDYPDSDPASADGYAITSVDEANGITWAADHGADVINISLGAFDQDPTEADAIKYAQDRGALVVAAAGNEATTTKSYPAAYPGVVAVGATDAAGHRAAFSNHGSWVTLAAPGVNIYSTVPGAGSTFWPDNTTYAAGSGTSFSSPLVAGAAALLVARHPEATAAQLRTALVRSAHGYAGLQLGTGQLDVNRLLDQLAPTTTAGTPTVEGTSGELTLTAVSDAEAVRFAVDGTPLPLASPTGGVARTGFASYGLPNGTHTVTAVDCTTGGTCSTTASSATVDLDNAAPTLTSPTTDVSGGFEFTAESPGGGVAFLVDGKKVAFDGTRSTDPGGPAYSVHYSASALADGSHDLTAVQCSAPGTRCDGPASAVVTVTARSLHPTVTAVSPSPFSPNGDRVRDTTTATYSLPDTETVQVSVENASGAVVRGPGTLGTLGRGTHTWVWNGRDNDARTLPTGTYTVVLTTSNGTLRGEVRRSVVLDDTGPALTAITGNKSGFYPYPDSYRDTFTPTAQLSEKATLSLQIRDSRKHVVKTISAVRNAGRVSLTWNGTNTARKRVGAGTYAWQFIAVDTAGNRRASASYRVTVSAKKLVSTSTSFTRTGRSGLGYYSTKKSCAYAAESRVFAKGVLLVNRCRPNSTFEKVEYGFRVTLPKATSYGTISLGVRGRSTHHPSQIAGLFVTTAGGLDVGTVRTINSARTANYSMGRVSAAGHSSGKHVAEFSIALGNTYTTSASKPSDFDIATVTLKVTYKVLR